MKYDACDQCCDPLEGFGRLVIDSGWALWGILRIDYVADLLCLFAPLLG